MQHHVLKYLLNVVFPDHDGFERNIGVLALTDDFVRRSKGVKFVATCTSSVAFDYKTAQPSSQSLCNCQDRLRTQLPVDSYFRRPTATHVKG